MRAAFTCLVALALVASTSERAEAVTFTELVISDAPPAAPNVMNFFLAPGGTTTFGTNPPSFFLGVDGGTSSWRFIVSPDAKFAQLQSTTPFGALTERVIPELEFNQPGGVEQPFNLDWQTVQYDWATGMILAAGPGSHTSAFNGTGGPPAGGPMALVGPVPEPATFAILGVGALLAASAARRSRVDRRAS